MPDETPDETPAAPNPARVAYLSDLAHACRQFQQAYYAGLGLANEGAQQGFLDAITADDLVGSTLADTLPTDAKVLAEFVAKVQALIQLASASAPGSTFQQALQRLARANR